MKLFQYAAIYNNPKDETVKPSLIVQVTNCLAADEKSALLMAARAIPEEYVTKLECVELIVRPF